MVGNITAAPASIIAADGWVIFDPAKDGQAYRYGPSMMINPNGSIDAWFASPGGKANDGSDQWDWIRHKHTVDGGKTWGAETVVLKATGGSRDQQSVCDPNWPAKVTTHGTAFERDEAEDSADVKFVDEFNAFVSISTAKRFTQESYINRSGAQATCVGAR